MERWTDRQGYLNKKGVFMRFPILFNCIKYASTRYSNAFMRKTKSYLEGEKDNNAIGSIIVMVIVLVMTIVSIIVTVHVNVTVIIIITLLLPLLLLPVGRQKSH